MSPEELRALLTQRQVNFLEKPLEHGVQFRCSEGEVFNVFNTGKVQLQGKKSSELAEAVLGLTTGASPMIREASVEGAGHLSRATEAIEKRVFIVYGHDIASRDQLELLLRRMGLDPIILQNLPAKGDTIIEKLEHYLGQTGNIGFACVLLTPDDEGNQVGHPDHKRYRARQNVILELGMVLARLGRKRVAILYKESVEVPSDIAGLLYIPYKERLDEVQLQLFRELKAAGYEPRA